MKLSTFLTKSILGQRSFENLGVELVKGPFEENGCGKVKSCFRNIDGCSIGEENCVLFSVQKAENSAIFEVVGTGLNKYAAVGITNTPGMPKTDVYYCINGSKDATFVQHAYAESHAQPVKIENPPELIVHDADWSKQNSVYHCRFERPLSVNFDYGDDSLIFDLNKSVNMLIAKGSLINNIPAFHGPPANKDKSKGNARAFNEIKLSDKGPFFNNQKVDKPTTTSTTKPTTKPTAKPTPTTSTTTEPTEKPKTKPTKKPTTTPTSSSFVPTVVSAALAGIGLLVF